ncbi:MAG: aryl-sulfate sulfotransferase [Deltaproteobacteria bacterium]|nr:aryl-sulfate sulfotransferase [Deltaproteobacteria bacterium]
MDCNDDGGAVPCSASGLGIDSAQLQANANNVLSAIGLVQSHGAASVAVLFETDGGAVQATPIFAAFDDGGAETLPVLGLAASTDYAMQFVASDGDGGLARSPVLDFSTAALPPEVAALNTFTVVQNGPVEPGYFVVPKLSSGTVTPPQPVMVVDRSGQVVWYVDLTTQPDGDFQKQPDGTYDVAAAGPYFNTVRTGIFEKFDVLGNLLASYTLPDPDGGTDPHELRTLPDGDMLILGDTLRVLDMTAYDGGSSATVIGNTLYRIHPDGGAAFIWDSFDHTTPADVDPALVAVTNNPLDETHCNAIDQTSDGNYLVSSRHMSQLWKIDATTGDVIWKLGRHGDFTFVNDPLNGFGGQHFARETAPDRILLFDDGNSHSPQVSRAAEYQLAFDPATGAPTTATLVWSYNPGIYGFAMGSAQRLPNGNTVITYGTDSRIDEVDPSGNLLWQLNDPHPAFGLYRGLFIDSLY